MPDLADIQLDYLPQDGTGIYLVGGTVRDLLLGIRPADLDLVVAGDIHRVAASIAGSTDGRIVDLGKKGFPILRVASSQVNVDITPLAQASIQANLAQRDFTINAMAYDLQSRQLIDCTGGRDDLRRRRIRMVSAAAFDADPARLVRAFRMAAVFGGSITPATQDAIGHYAHRIGTVAGERIWAELVKFFAVDTTAALVNDMAASGLLAALFPELEATRGCIQNEFHQWDVFEHSLRAYGHLERLLNNSGPLSANHSTTAWQSDLDGYTPILKYSALLHDVGKPETRTIDATGRLRFCGHAARGAAITATISRRLRLSAKQWNAADGIIRHHLRPLFLFQAFRNNTIKRRGLVRFFNQCGRLAIPIIVHTQADIMAKGQTPGQRDKAFLAFCNRLFDIYNDYRDRQTTQSPLINGRDLIKDVGLSPSPRFATILKRVQEGQLSGELASRDQALDWVRSYLKRKGCGSTNSD